MKWGAGDWHRRFTMQARWTEQIRQYCVNQLNLDRCRRILEAGCGTGYATARLAVLAKSVLAVDISEGMIRQARRRLQARGIEKARVVAVHLAAARRRRRGHRRVPAGRHAARTSAHPGHARQRWILASHPSLAVIVH